MMHFEVKICRCFSYLRGKLNSLCDTYCLQKKSFSRQLVFLCTIYASVVHTKPRSYDVFHKIAAPERFQFQLVQSHPGVRVQCGAYEPLVHVLAVGVVYETIVSS